MALPEAQLSINPESLDQLASWSHPHGDKFILIILILIPQAGTLFQEQPVLCDLLPTPWKSIYPLLPTCRELCGSLGWAGRNQSTPLRLSHFLPSFWPEKAKTSWVGPDWSGGEGIRVTNTHKQVLYL